MAHIENKLTQQFYEWEQRGRGTQIFEHPVTPEPPFKPFYGHFVKSEPIPDDGRRHTFLSAFVERLGQRLSPEAREAPPEVEEGPEIESFERTSIVEIHTSLPPNQDISKELFEQFILSLANCQEPVAFELIGTPESITTQLVASEGDADLIQQQLEAHFPEAVFTRQDSFLQREWKRAETKESVTFEFGLEREFMIPMATVRNFNNDPFIGLVAAISNLREGELAMFQVIFKRVHHPWGESIMRSVSDGSGKDFFVNRPELLDEAKKKVSKQLYAAVIRIAIKSDSRMLEIAKDIGGALTVFSNPNGNSLVPLKNSDYPFEAHEEDVLRRQSHRTGMILNSDELISLVHLPSSSVRSPKLKREAQKTKVAPKIALNHHGLLLGINSIAGITNEVRLNAEQRVRHTYIIGTSGTGKSTLLFQMIRQDIENGQGLAVFDPHGDLIDKILGCIPEKRIDDVVLVDPSDQEYSIGFNILSAHSDLEKNLLASDLVSVFQRLSTSWGDQMGSVLNNAILAFLESNRGGTLADLQRFLIEPAFRNEFLKTVHDTQVLYFWKRAFPQLTGNKSIGPVLTRLSAFLDRKPVRYMVTQKENKLDFARIMDGRKIFLAKLSQGEIGNENAYLLGSFLVSKFQQLAMSRQAQAASERKDFWCYCDEFHNFITPSMAQILSGARKYRLGLILAHQELRQLQRDSEVASAVLANPYTRICFRVGDDDARKLGDGFSFFDSKDLQNIPNFQAICRVERSDYDFNLAIPYLPEPGEAEAAERRKRVITASREKYSVPRKQIEAEQLAAFFEEEEYPVPAKSGKAKLTKDSPVTKPAPVIEPAESKAATPAPAPLIEKEIVPPVEIRVEDPKMIPAPQDKGIGGHQHNLIRERIEMVASQLGYSTSRENPTGKGGKIDVVLEKAARAIACEIAITTTIDHEVGNVSKCLVAGFQHIAVISPSADRLEKIANAVRACVSPEQVAHVAFFHPDNFIAHLQELAIQDSIQSSAGTPKEKQYGKYKVKSSAVNLTQDEIKAREEAAFGMLAETMRKTKKQTGEN